jgi:glycosyltransferase involved in cell wall biosynthesis
MNQKETNPKITVFMPVYNGEKHLREAVESILNQTFNDFEFLIINDGSQDKSSEIIKSYKDPRITFLENPKNLGVAKTRNIAFDKAKGEYIVFNDCDDVSLPNRLGRLTNFMDNNPDIDLCGSWMGVFGENIKPWILKTKKYHSEIKSSLFFVCEILLGSAILRKKSFIDNNLKFDEKHKSLSEDFELWVRSQNIVKYHNLQEILVKYRQVISSVTHCNDNSVKFESLIPVMEKNLSYIGLHKDIYNLEMYKSACLCDFPRNSEYLNRLEKWLMELKRANNTSKAFNCDDFNKVLSKKWFWLCWQCSFLGLKTFIQFFRSPLIWAYEIEPKILVKFMINCLFKK